MTKRYLSRGELEQSARSSAVFKAGVVVFEVEHTDLKRAAPPESPDEAAQRHERLFLHHHEQYQRLTGKEPRELTWTCVVCNVTHPVDHAGLFCGVCKIMAACCGCELTFKGQCHVQPLTADEIEMLRTAALIVESSVQGTRSRNPNTPMNPLATGAPKLLTRLADLLSATCRTWTSPSTSDFTGACSRCGRLPEEHR